MKTTSTGLLITALISLSATILYAAPIPEDAKVGGFAVGAQAWTFNRFSVFEAIEKNAAAGAKAIEFFPGQKLSPDRPELKFDHNASDEVINEVMARLSAVGMRAVNYGVVNAKGEAEWRKIFELAKKMKLYAVTTESVSELDVIEKLAKEYDIRVGIHNHPRRPNDPNYKVWDPEYIASVVKNRDPRIGAAADTGHWATSGIEPIDALKILRGRVVSVHLKDRPEKGRQVPDVPFGAGVLNISGILDALRSQKFGGNVSIEYETNWDKSVTDVAQCVGFFRGYQSVRF